MVIEILISDISHPILKYLNEWALGWKKSGYIVSIVNNSKNLTGGDFLFLVSCSEIIKEQILKKFKHALVLHASDLPEGKGWSPHVWNILEGKNTLTISLLNAASKVDAGDIWIKTQVTLEGHELFDEINHKLFIAELELMSKAINSVNEIIPKAQVITQGNYYAKRTPEDSRLDPNKTLLQQFNLLRIADEERYPAFFEHLGCKYIVTIKKG